MHWWTSKRIEAKIYRARQNKRKKLMGKLGETWCFPAFLIHASLSHLPLIPASPSLCSCLFILKGCSVWVCVERPVTSLRLLPFSLPLLNYPWLPLANYHQILESETHTHYYSARHTLTVEDLKHHWTVIGTFIGRSHQGVCTSLSKHLCVPIIYFFLRFWIVRNYE